MIALNPLHLPPAANECCAKKRILFLTGTRADFGKLKPLIKKIDHSENFECLIFSTGMHTLSRYGSTFDEIRKSGFKNIYLHINQMASNSSDMDMVLANTIHGFGYYIREFKPDLIVVHGDRVEALAGAIVGTLNNILVAHIEGGEISGTVDEIIRHSVTKLSHLHFVANEEARLRLIQMGESRGSIFVIGSPEVDIMLSRKLPTLKQAKKRYDIDFEKYILFSFHPVTTDLHHLLQNIETIMAALKESGLNVVAIYPNNDWGSEIILEALEKRQGEEWFKLFPSLRFEHFLTLLKNADAIVGNSSAGIREAPVYGIPTINIGDRQKNRFLHSSIINVIEDKKEILKALNHLPGNVSPSLHFGNGKSAGLFLKHLENEVFWDTDCQKQFKDLNLNALLKN